MTPPWRPDKYQKRRPNLIKRQQIIRTVRRYFEAQGFNEVDTPCLQMSPGNEVHLQAFQTALRDYHGGADQTLYLHTSPEFAMKKLLVAGEEKIFQIAHVFRNGERSSRHHPEFSMMEWYRAHETLEALMEDCTALTRAAAKEVGIKEFYANGISCDPFASWEILKIPDAFARYADIDILATAPNPHAPDAELLRSAMAHLDIRHDAGDSWDDLFFRIMDAKIEPHLGKGRPTFLRDYPISMAALSKANQDDPRLAQRFELYICNLELANAFYELTDPREQLARFQHDMDLKESLHGERYPIDMDFIKALEHGMPSSTGIALGIDRLIMLCCSTENIEEVLWMPVCTDDEKDS
ncbi:MAG: EF-P lysine aminoacylase EpmA [Bdellovibrionales bacterium]